MKRKILGLAFAGVLAPLAAIAASTSHNLSVSATVQGHCRFDDVGPTALGFGSIDPTSTTNKTATATVSFRCTRGTMSSISGVVGANDASGVHYVSDGTNDMAYTVSFGGSDVQPGTGYGSGNEKTLTVTGTIAVTDFQNAPAGTYSDTLQLTFAP